MKIPVWLVQTSFAGMMVVSALSGCSLFEGKPAGSIPSFTLAPKQQFESPPPLVVFLPGRGDDLDDLKSSGVGEAIQQVMPEAEVLLVGATLPYYKEGHLMRRLQDQIIAPARARGIREIWLAGISMGGMGTILYEHDHPGELAGLVLFSPYMGESNVVDQVAANGGPRNWNPGPVPQHRDTTVAPLQEWLTVKSWAEQPLLATRIWFACGTTDRFQPAARMIEPLLPPGQVFSPEGGHDWSVWLPASREVFAKIEAARQRQRP